MDDFFGITLRVILHRCRRSVFHFNLHGYAVGIITGCVGLQSHHGEEILHCRVAQVIRKLAKTKKFSENRTLMTLALQLGPEIIT